MTIGVCISVTQEVTPKIRLWGPKSPNPNCSKFPKPVVELALIFHTSKGPNIPILK